MVIRVHSVEQKHKVTLLIRWTCLWKYFSSNSWYLSLYLSEIQTPWGWSTRYWVVGGEPLPLLSGLHPFRLTQLLLLRPHGVPRPEGFPLLCLLSRPGFSGVILLTFRFKPFLLLLLFHSAFPPPLMALISYSHAVLMWLSVDCAQSSPFCWFYVSSVFPPGIWGCFVASGGTVPPCVVNESDYTGRTMLANNLEISLFVAAARIKLGSVLLCATP